MAGNGWVEGSEFCFIWNSMVISQPISDGFCSGFFSCITNLSKWRELHGSGFMHPVGSPDPLFLSQVHAKSMRNSTVPWSRPQRHHTYLQMGGNAGLNEVNSVRLFSHKMEQVIFVLQISPHAKGDTFFWGVLSRKTAMAFSQSHRSYSLPSKDR